MLAKTKLRATEADPNQQFPDQPHEKCGPGNAPRADPYPGQRRIQRSYPQQDNGETERNKYTLTPPGDEFIHVLSGFGGGTPWSAVGTRSRAQENEQQNR